MSGHSHWATIKHKKGKEDQRKGKVFSRCSKAITAATRAGGKDPDSNLALKYAIEEAKSSSMPKDNIERAILKGAGELEGVQLESVRYEGYGPGGAAVMLDVLTDNRNRNAPVLRTIFNAHSGELGVTGCVSWTFETKGLILLKLGKVSEEQAFDIAIEAGADDFQPAGELFEVDCAPRNLPAVRQALINKGLAVESAQVTQVPKTYVDLDMDEGRKMMKLMEELEDHEDVTGVFSNFNLPPELIAEMENG